MPRVEGSAEILHTSGSSFSASTLYYLDLQSLNTDHDDTHPDLRRLPRRSAVVEVLRRDSEFQKLLALYRRMNTVGNSQQPDGIEAEKAALVDSMDHHLGETLEEFQQKLSNTMQARIHEAEIAVNNRGPIRRDPRRSEV